MLGLGQSEFNRNLVRPSLHRAKSNQVHIELGLGGIKTDQIEQVKLGSSLDNTFDLH